MARGRASWWRSGRLRRIAAASLALAIALGLGFRGGSGEERSAVIEVIDGDTLLIDRRYVQLAGIDAPELGQLCLQEDKTWPCGLEAARALTKLVALGRIHCEIDAAQEPLPTAACRSGEENVAETMLRQGYALALPGGFPGYAEAQAAAQKVPLGIWRGAFVAPSAWRDGARLAQEQAGDKACPIKAVVEADGRKVYLLPSDGIYGSVALRPEAGERLFCSDEAARAAGWTERPAKPR